MNHDVYSNRFLSEQLHSVSSHLFLTQSTVESDVMMTCLTVGTVQTTVALHNSDTPTSPCSYFATKPFNVLVVTVCTTHWNTKKHCIFTQGISCVTIKHNYRRFTGESDWVKKEKYCKSHTRCAIGFRIRVSLCFVCLTEGAFLRIPVRVRRVWQYSTSFIACRRNWSLLVFTNKLPGRFFCYSF